MRLLLSSLLFCAILAVELVYLGAVLKPTRSLLTGEAGAAWSGYLQQPRDTLDVVVFGNSHVFDGIDTTVFWKHDGITGYNMAGPTQPLKITQYYVAEALRTQRPKVVAIEASLLPYDETNYVKAFQEINVGYMPWGANKLRAAFLDTPAADRVGVLVDLWTYHSRWNELRFDTLSPLPRDPGDAFLKGWQPVMQGKEVTATQPATATPPSARTLAAVDANIVILRTIAQTSRDNNVRLLLFLTPTGPPNLYSWQLDRARAALASDYPEVKILDLSSPGAVPGLDWKTDFRDGGHLTYKGSAKASATMADFLARTYGLAGHSADPAYAFWNVDAEHHDALIRKLGGTP